MCGVWCVVCGVWCMVYGVWCMCVMCVCVCVHVCACIHDHVQSMYLQPEINVCCVLPYSEGY